ncbi:LETM1-like protein family protein [Cryptosporidium meleagridis]|uniref:LETM1-like protein family protein n=1 Tax=Cryptosporidium meleagridis TaxID=93969 RepID=A0A2P4Z3Z5_9CRYT|nr:LETM1-like protein family protein [Cryptosporidium meleagridis]
MIRFKRVVEGIPISSYLKGFSHALKEGFNLSVCGFRLFFFNLKCTNSLIQKRILGNGLTFNEKQLVKTTIKDTIKIIPFSFFIIVPFAEFGLPFVIKLFPNMLPSTFALKSIMERDENILNKRKIELLEFHSIIQNTISNLKKSDNSDIISGAKSLEKIHLELLEKNKLNQEELSKVISGPIKEEFKLENLNIETLQSISRVLGIPSTRSKLLLMLRIRHRTLKLKNEDKDILWDGTDQMNKQQLQKALISRVQKITYELDKIIFYETVTFIFNIMDSSDKIN